MPRQIVCYRIPAFQVALARLEQPSLRGRPLALAPSTNSHAPVLEVSREAEHEGIHVGMSVGQARRLCPALTLVPPDPPTVREAVRTIESVIARVAPAWESPDPGCVVFDLTGTTRLFGRACDTAAAVERELAERFRLVGVAGVATNKLVAEVASTVIEPWHVYDVRPGAESAFLSPLPVHVLPVPARERRWILSLFDDLHIATLGQLAAYELADLEPIVGSFAAHVLAWARGVDETPVQPPARQPSLEATVVLEDDVIDVEDVRRRLDGVLETLCSTLRRRRQACRLLTLRLRYRDHRESCRSYCIGAGCCWEGELAHPLHQLLYRTFQRRVRVRSATLALGALHPATHQLTFAEICPAFASPTAGSDDRRIRSRRLSLALDTIRAKFGQGAIVWGRAIG
ncbi:MAG: hypothetical protein D6690_08410 [Nitrospirae bacterium]|nr:MAG: hypothetical protein D6690_08410 [Nitrospirota bacterium]